MTSVIARHLNPKLNPQGILKSFCEHVSSRKTHQKKSIETRERKKRHNAKQYGYGIASNTIFVRVCDIYSEEIWYIFNYQYVVSYKNTV